MSEKFDRPLITIIILSGEPQWRQETLSPIQCLHAIHDAITTEQYMHCIHNAQVGASDEFDKLLI